MAGSLGGEWQAHAGAAGFGGLNTLTHPLSQFPVQTFFLLEMPRGDLARKWFEERKVKLEERLQKAGAQRVLIWRAHLWDPVDVARCIVKGMEAERLPTLHFNVSSGPNTVSVGATLAAMFWDVRLYHAKPDYSGPAKLRESVEGFPVEALHRLPPFRAQPPRPESLAALLALAADQTELLSTDWKKLLESKSVIRPKGKTPATKPMSAQAIHGQFEGIVRPLLDLGLVTEAWHYGKRTFSVTDQGRAFARLFEGSGMPKAIAQEI